jgi:hypothetical protein
MAASGKMALRASAGIVAAGLFLLAPAMPAQAGLFERIFGGLSHALRAPEQLPDTVREFAPPSFERPEQADRLRERASGPSKAFCVRTCDGHFFPVQAHAGLSAAEACHAFCPASQTQIYTGGRIDDAVARDGARYADLTKAFVYRKQLIAGCTCNGRDQFGLARIDINSDPTLRPGDVVATQNGMAAFTGRKNQAAQFTPADSYPQFSKQYRQQLSAMQIMPPNPGAPNAAEVKLPLASERAQDGGDRSAKR